MELNSKDHGRHHLYEAMKLACRSGGWTTTELVGLLLWWGNEWRLKRAQVLLRRVARDGLMEPRRWNGTRIYVVTRRGAEWADAQGITPVCGDQYGKINRDGVWSPPLDHEHAHRSLQFLLSDPASSFVTESEIRRSNAGLEKIPDGLLHSEGRWFWVETERARKTGAAARELAQCLIKVACGRAPNIRVGGGLEVKPTGAVVVIPDYCTDERGYKIDHKHRIVEAVRRQLHLQVVTVCFSTERYGTWDEVNIS